MKNKHSYIVKATPPSQRKTRLLLCLQYFGRFLQKRAFHGAGSPKSFNGPSMVLQSYQNPSRPTMDLGSGTRCPPLGDVGPWCKGVVNLLKKWCSCPTTVVEIMSFGGVSNLWSDPDLPHATLIKQLVRWHHHALPLTFLVRQNGPEKGKEIMFASLVSQHSTVGYDAHFLMKRSNENISNMSPKKRGPLSKGKDSSNHYFLGENC